MNATLAARKPFVVGIAGGSGAGKSTLVSALRVQLGPECALVLNHDAYYHDASALEPGIRSTRNYDHPDALETTLLIEQLDRLSEGGAVEVPSYDFASHTRRVETRRAEPHPVILIDGILCLADPDLRERIDLAIFVDADPHARLERRLARDVRERGRTRDDVIRQFSDSVQPMHRKYVEPSRRFADLAVPGHGRTGVSTVIAEIRRKLQQRAEN